LDVELVPFLIGAGMIPVWLQGVCRYSR